MGKKAVFRAVFAGLLSFAGAALGHDRVVMQLGWMAEPEFGGFFQAQQIGLYQAADIDLDLKLGSPQSNTLQLLLAGRADFAVAPSSDVLNAVREGLPLVAVAAIFQRDPRVLISHKGVGNDTLESMRGKPIMVAPSDRVTFWPFLRQKYGFTDEQIRPYMFNTGPFMANKTAIQQGYVTNEPFALEKLGAHLNVILLSDRGYDSYAETIVTTRRLIENSPNLVQRLVDASIRGWYAYLYANPAAANNFIKQNNPEMADDQIAYSINEIKHNGLVDSGDAKSNGIGAMSDARWRTLFEQMASLGIYPPALEYRRAYTLQFVNKHVGP